MSMSSRLMIEFLEWVSERARTYDEAMEAWQSHCPRQAVWEDAFSEELVRIRTEGNRSGVCLTWRGEEELRRNGKFWLADRTISDFERGEQVEPAGTEGRTWLPVSMR